VPDGGAECYRPRYRFVRTSGEQIDVEYSGSERRRNRGDRRGFGVAKGRGPELRVVLERGHGRGACRSTPGMMGGDGADPRLPPSRMSRCCGGGFDDRPGRAELTRAFTTGGVPARATSSDGTAVARCRPFRSGR